MPTLLSESTPISRGKVRCDLCGHAIPAGTRYRAQTTADDGRASTWRECPTCAAAADGWLETADRWDLEEGYRTDTIDEWANDHPADPRATAYLIRRRGNTTTPDGTGAATERCGHPDRDLSTNRRIRCHLPTDHDGAHRFTSVQEWTTGVDGAATDGSEGGGT